MGCTPTADATGCLASIRPIPTKNMQIILQVALRSLMGVYTRGADVVDFMGNATSSTVSIDTAIGEKLIFQFLLTKRSIFACFVKLNLPTWNVQRQIHLKVKLMFFSEIHNEVSSFYCWSFKRLTFAPYQHILLKKMPHSLFKGYFIENPL